MSSIYDIPVQKISGEQASLAEFKGKVLLVVNVASKCGLTPQYEGLEKLYERFHDKGLVVAGFPANDFKEQEPGTNSDIQSFCTTNYGVKFPMFSKIAVTGAEKHPLYKSLISAQPAAKGDPAGWAAVLKQHNIDANAAPEIQWNFEKFVVARNGEIAARFSPNTAPDNPELLSAIESELAKN
jgi:glutathione peroxidase